MKLISQRTVEHFGKMLGESTTLQFVCEPDGLIVSTNDVAKSVLGWKRTDNTSTRRIQEIVFADQPLPTLKGTVARTKVHLDKYFPTETFEKSTDVLTTSLWNVVKEDGLHLKASLIVSAIQSPKGVVSGYLILANVKDIGHPPHNDVEQWFESSIDLHCIATTDGYFTKVNPAFSKLLGWSETDLLSRSFLDFVHLEDRGITQNELRSLSRGVSTRQFENRYQHKDGSWHTLSWSVVPRSDGLLIGSARDVTEIRETEVQSQNNQRLLNEALKKIGEGMIVTDSSGVVTSMNPSAEDMTGWCQDEALGHSLKDIFRLADEVTGSELEPLCLRKESESLNSSSLRSPTLISKNGHRVPISEFYSELQSDDGSQSGFVVIFRSARDARKLEQKLLNRVDQRTRELAREQRRIRNGNLVLESAASEASLEETLDLILRFVSEEDPSGNYGVLLLDSNTKELDMHSARGLDASISGSRATILGELSWIRQASLEGVRIIVEHLNRRHAEALDGESKDSFPYHSAWAEPIKANDGRVLGVFVCFRNSKGTPSQEEIARVGCACSLARVAIERAQVHEALEISERRYKTLLERIPAPIFVYDTETLEYLAVSDRALEDYGYSRAEFQNLTIEDIRPKEDVGALRKMLANASSNFENRGIWKHVKQSGEVIDVQIYANGFDLHGRQACIILAIDTTDQIRAQTELVRAEKLKAAILESSLDCLVTINEAGEILEFNSAAETTFGYARSQAIGQHVHILDIQGGGLGRPDDTSDIRPPVSTNPFETGRVRSSARKRNGDPFPIELAVVTLEVVDQQLYTAFIRDISESLKAEQDLLRKTELLQAVADGSTDAVFIKDLQGRYLLFNEAASRVTGRRIDQVLGHDDRSLMGEENGLLVMKNDKGVMEANTACIVEERLELDGEIRYFNAMKAPFRNASGSVIGIIGISRDITDRKRMEAEIRASEERYRLIVEESPEAIFIKKKDRIAFVNKAALELLDAQCSEDLLGSSFHSFFRESDQKYITSQLEGLLLSPSSFRANSQTLISLRGKILEVDVHAISYLNQESIEIQIVCRNVTAMRNAMIALQKHVKHAEFSSAIGTALSQESDLNRMLNRCSDAMVLHLDAPFARIWILNEQYDSFELIAQSVHADTFDMKGFVNDVCDALMDHVVSSNSTVTSENFQLAFKELKDRTNSSTAISRFTGMPLTVEGRCIGVVIVFRGEDSVEDLTDALQMAAAGISNNIQRIWSKNKLNALNRNLEQRVRERTIELEGSEQFNRATLDSLSASIAVVNKSGEIVKTNQKWKDYATQNKAPFQSVCEGVNYLQVCDNSTEIGSNDAPIVAKALRDILDGRLRSWSHEYPCHASGEKRWFLCQATLAFIRNEPYAVVAHEDVTKIKLAQEELLVAKENATQASVAKSEFLATMNHELRSPLNGILGMNSLLLRTQLDATQRRYAEECQSCGQLLLQLINDVLDVSKIEAGKLEIYLQPTKIHPLIEDVAKMFNNTANEKGLYLRLKLAPTTLIPVMADDKRLRQVIVNALSNALKFTHTGGVTIQVSRVNSHMDRSVFRFEIVDTGIGILAERIDRLFKPFTQIDGSTTRQYGGTGLGLSICKQLVSLMGGRIGIDSLVGKGTTLWFEIPMDFVEGEGVCEPAVQADASVERPKGVASHYENTLTGHLLVVEDNRINQLYICELLRLFGCTYDLAENGAQAIAWMEKSRFDVILMDCQMPEMDGFAATSEIRRRESLGKVAMRSRIIALTANAMAGDRERCLRAGMDDYISKPVLAPDLHKALMKFCKKSDLEGDVPSTKE